MNTYFFINWAYTEDGKKIEHRAGPYRDRKYASVIAADLPALPKGGRVEISLREMYFQNNKWIDVSNNQS